MTVWAAPVAEQQQVICKTALGGRMTSLHHVHPKLELDIAVCYLLASLVPCHWYGHYATTAAPFGWKWHRVVCDAPRWHHQLCQ